MENQVFLKILGDYDERGIYESLPDEVFSVIKPGHIIVLKPNWVMESHKTRKSEWEYVITHPALITAVLQKALDRLKGNGRIIITDGPMTEASFSKLISKYPAESWRQAARRSGVDLEIMDLRDYEWETDKDIIVNRIPLPGDPRGKVEYNLQGRLSEFYAHTKSARGYYGADYNRAETNRAHDGDNNLYSVSRTVLEADVFINLPKLKTHRKAGMTCCLKNLVGINTYKNFLPHHLEGGQAEGGDQFPDNGFKAKIEGPLTAFVKQNILRRQSLAKYFGPLNLLSRKVLGKTGKVIRSGNWHGNDTIWRMIADLNKILFYGNPDGTMRPENPAKRKAYIGIVDAIRAGEGFGPLEPEPVNMNYLICGTNPAAIDRVAATLMGFDCRKIPSISRMFDIRHYNFTPFRPEDIHILHEDSEFSLSSLPRSLIVPFEPPLGWKGYVEMTGPESAP